MRYIHPNALFISWNHFVPSYIRSELKKKTGIVINEFGQKIDENEDETDNIKAISNDPNEILLQQKSDINQNGKVLKKEYTPIKSYKPSGNLIYDDDLLNKINDRFH